MTTAAVRLLRDAGGVVRLPVEGASMWPLLQAGDHVRVRAGAAARVGDVAVADTPAGLLVHRVMKVGSREITLCGDNVPRCDRPVALEGILGRVVAVEGDTFRRLDGRGARLAGIAVALYARARAAAGGRPARPGPGRLARTYVVVSDACPPAARAEDRLALYLASPRARARARPASTEGIDWGLVAERSLLGQIGPLVFVGAQRSGMAESLMPEALEPLRGQYLGNVLRTGTLRGILTEMLERLEEAGIPVMAHKGVALAATVYEDPALRVMGDIDLCVRDGDRRRAEALVADIRRELVRQNPDRRSRSGYHVELDGTAHHDLDPAASGGGRWSALSLDWEGIWDRAERVNIATGTVLVPCPTDLLLTLVANSVRRGFTPVRLVVDVAHVIERFRDGIDWFALEAELRRTRLDRRSWFALGLAAEWCGAEVPARLLEPPHDLRTAVYERQLLEWKRRRPFARLPTRVLWAGSWRGAAGAARRLLIRRR